MLIPDILIFVGFIIFFLYLPAKLLFGLLKLKIDDKLTEAGLAVAAGTVLITLYAIVIKSIGLDWIFLWLIFVASSIYLAFNFRTEKIRVKWGHPFLFLVLLTGVVTQNLVLFRGGAKTPNGLIFPSLHDTMWNIALSAELFHHFPPENPAISGILLKNNHYFYPLFLSVSRYLTGIDILDLYFRLGPVLISLLFGLGIYSVGSLFTKNIYFKGIIMFLGYFSGNFAYLVPAVLGGNFDWKGNTFFADQPFDQIINPYSVFGFVLMLFGIYCVSRVTTHREKFSWDYSVIGGLLLGSLYGFKSFGGITVILALGATFLLSLFFTRKLFLLPIAFLSLILFMGIFFLTTDVGSASLIWAPGWLLTQMMTDKDKLNLPRFADLEMYYQSTANYLGLFKIKLIELTIYLVGNLGTRIVGLISLLYILLVTHVHSRKYIIQFIAIIVFISLIIPLLFNLRNSTFNIIQFTPYSLVLLAVISGYALEKIYQYFAQKHKKMLGILLVIIFIVLSVPVNIKNILSKLEPPKDLILNEEIAALRYLRENTKTTDKVLIDPNQFSQDPIYIAALAERRIYLASPGYAVQTGLDPKERMAKVKDFFKNPDREFLEREKISYIYYLKTGVSDTSGLSELGAVNFFENDRVIIWKAASQEK